MSQNHEGVSCDSCLQSSFRGRRYKCLLCYDFDLCAACFEARATRQHHTPDHPMQCILSRADIQLYYGGESLPNSEQPQSYTCPYCCKMGFTYATLASHVLKEHGDNPHEVICPVCVTTPGGDPNRLTEDLARHLTVDHHPGSRDISLLNEAVRAQDSRRTPQPQAAFRGRNRPFRRSSMQFHGFLGSGLTAALRDPANPIADLLSHLSEVRRTESNTSRGSFPPQFWQLDEPRNIVRQHLERSHQGRSSSSERRALNAEPSKVSSHLPAAPSSSSSAAASSSQSNFLLPKAFAEESASKTDESAGLPRSHFVKELVLSTISKLENETEQDKCTNSEEGSLKSTDAEAEVSFQQDNSVNPQRDTSKPVREEEGDEEVDDDISKELEKVTL